MHRQGAEFVAADCMTKGIVAEIRHGRSEPQTALPICEAAGSGATE
jgi:hypothetical protein